MTYPLSLNLYIYAQGNPLEYIDPTGHDKYRRDHMQEAQKFASEVRDEYIEKIDEFLKRVISDTYKEDAPLVLVQWEVVRSLNFIGDSLKLKQTSDVIKETGEAVFKNIDEGLNFTTTTAKHMDNAGRYVPVDTLRDAIKSTKGLLDPQGEMH